ncbi:MAG TPA: hypothetical protein VFM18_19105 [Methanosarcina sp.]|nr:hypothetical protein [Methanosarcina sp.]
MPVLPNSSLPGASGTGSILSQLGSAVESSLLGAVGVSPAATRQNVSSMFNYSNKTSGPSPVFIYPDASTDWRVRVSLAPNAKYFYNDPNNTLLSPLVKEVGGGTNAVAGLLGGAGGGLFGHDSSTGSQRIGVVFPYTPSISITHTANYDQQKLTHTNYANYFYTNSEVQPIQISAEFTVQNINEGQYLLASIYFFRSLTKMFFGADPQAGNPPPIVYLNGYGQYYLPNVPCVITSFQHQMPADVDYMDVPEPVVTNKNYNPQFTNYRLNSTRLPTYSTMSVTLQPVYSRIAQSQGFSLNDFANGALINPPNAAKPASSFGASQPAKYATGYRPNGGFL